MQPVKEKKEKGKREKKEKRKREKGCPKCFFRVSFEFLKVVVSDDEVAIFIQISKFFGFFGTEAKTFDGAARFWRKRVDLLCNRVKLYSFSSLPGLT